MAKQRKGLSQAQKKEMYLDDLRSRQEAVKRGGKDAIRYSQAAYGALQKEGYNVFENEQARNIANQVVSDAIDKKYDQKFAKQVQSASKRFDAITRYDDMLGISSNPYQKVSPKYNMFTQGGKTSSINKKNKKK